jgi:transposase-like protein
MKSIKMTANQKTILNRMATEAKNNSFGEGKGRRFAVTFKRKVVETMKKEGIASTTVSNALAVSPNTLAKWKRTYKADKYAPIAVATGGRPKTKGGSNVSIKSLEARRAKAVEQFVKAKNDIQKIDKALAILDSLDLSSL